jgi:hypothetical protein
VIASISNIGFIAFFVFMLSMGIALLRAAHNPTKQPKHQHKRRADQRPHRSSSRLLGTWRWMSGQPAAQGLGFYQPIGLVGRVMPARTRRFGVFRTTQPLRSAQTRLRITRGLPVLLSISNSVTPGVAGCLGNESMSGRGGSLMKRLWIREVRRAARCASAPFARQVALGCGAAAAGTMAASLLPLQSAGVAAQAAWAAVLAAAGYVAIWTGFVIYHLWRYRSSGFRDDDWLARHDDSDPGGALFLELRPRSSGSPNPGVDLELWVKSHGNWEIVDGDDLVLVPDKVIRCRFDLNHEVFPSGFYDVRWFRADDRGKLVEITRERFQLRNHSIGPLTRSVSRTNPRLASKALPASKDEVKPRRAVEIT